MALYMTYTCAKPHFFKYSLSLYTLSTFLSPITQLPRSLIWFPAPFFSLFPSLSYFSTSPFLFSGFLHSSSLDGFLHCSSPISLRFPLHLSSSFQPSPSPGDYFFSCIWVSCTDLLWVSCTDLLWVSCGSLLFLQVIISSFGFFLSKFRSFHVSTVYFPLCCSHG